MSIQNLNKRLDRHPITLKEIKFGTANSFDEHATSNSIQELFGKCKSLKFLRTQSFGMPSPKTQRKGFDSIQNMNSNLVDSCSSASVGDSSEQLNSRSFSSSKSSVSTLSQVQEIIYESEFDVGEVRGLERLKRLRCRYRKASFSVESNDIGRNKR